MDDTRTPDFELSGGDLALDFVNTWGDRGRPETERLRSYADLVAFAACAEILDAEQAAGLAARAAERPEAAAEGLAAALELRQALYRIFSARASGAEAAGPDLERLSATAARAAGRRRLEPRDREFVWLWHGLDTTFQAPLAPVALAAADLLTGGDLDRLRECDGEDCTWLFLDASRNRSRRWCSMESCGNRAKARRHYRRLRGQR